MKNLYRPVSILTIVFIFTNSFSLAQVSRHPNVFSASRIAAPPRTIWRQAESSSSFRSGASEPPRAGTVSGLPPAPIVDTTFGDNGTERDSIYGGDLLNASAQSVAIQRDGKIVVAGALSGNYYSLTQNYAIAIARYDTDGTLDTTFGGDGKVSTPTNGAGGSWDPSESVVIEPNGKILVAGTTKTGSGEEAIILARYTSAGVLDSTFGTYGTTITNVSPPSSNDDASSIAVQADGKIIVAGTSSGRFLVVRYDSNGVVDNSFGTNGFATTHIPGGTGIDIARSVAIQTNGRIFVAGYSERSSGYVFALACFNSDGILDNTFGSGGTASTVVDSVTGGSSFGESVALQQDGKILIAGYTDDMNSYKFALVRYDTTGSVDTTFAVDGTALTQIAGANGKDFGNSVKVDSRGRIILGGYSGYGLNPVLEVARFKSNGAPDSTFGTDGTTLTDVSGSTGGAFAAAIALQADGKVVECATSYAGAQQAFALARYDTNGAADNTFGKGGSLTTSFGGAPYDDYATSVVILPDGKVLAAGSSAGEFALARYNENGTPDGSFGIHGTVRSIVGQGEGSSSQGQSIAVQSDGKIVMAGSSSGPTTSAVTVARYYSSGTIDSSFGKGGVARVQINGGSGNDYSNSVAIQRDGKIVVGGSSFTGANTVFALARFNSNGTPDNTFGTGGTVRTAINGGGTADMGLSVAIMPDGKIILAGYSNDGSGIEFSAACYDTNGTLDKSFGTNGTVMFPINGGDGTGDYGEAVAITPDGNIVMIGQSRNGSSNSFAVALLDSTGTLVRSFGNNGTVRTSIAGGDGTGDHGYSVAVQPDGKILVGGESFGGGEYEFALARYDADGILDSTFNGNGMVRIPIAGSDGLNDMGDAIALGSNGKIVLAGSSSGPTGGMFALARFFPGTAPFAGTMRATDVTDTSAVIAGDIYPYGAPTTARFLFGKTAGNFTDSISASPSTATGDTVSTFHVPVAGLSPMTTYYYTTSGSRSSSGLYFLGSEQSFTTLPPVPPSPMLISPDTITGVPRRATFTWDSSAYAKSYRLQIATDEYFKSVVFDSTLTDTTLHLSTALADTTHYYWRVSATGESGTSAYSIAGIFVTGTGIDLIDQQVGLPKNYALFQNYPNPFNPSTTIKIALPAASRVSLVVYDILGREVSELVDARLQAGYYEFKWDGWKFASGVYFYRLTAQSLNGENRNFVQTKKLLLMK